MSRDDKPQTRETGASRFRDALTQRPGAEPEEERLLWEGGYSAKAMIGSWILAVAVSVVAGIGLPLAGGPAGFAVLGVLLLVIWGGLGLLLVYRKINVHYELTNYRFTHQEGILRRMTDRIEVIDMDDVTCVQGIIQRLVNVGSIEIQSSDATHPVLELIGIDGVKDIALLIDDARRAERMRRGVHIESV